MGSVFCKPCCCDCPSRDEARHAHELQQRLGAARGRRRRRQRLGDSPEADYVALDNGERDATAPVPFAASAYAAAAEEKMKSWFSSRPPSVEDEKQYMRMSLRRILEEQDSAPRECILCLDGFSADAPEARTLCRCGVNRNSLHVACLIAWRERSGKTACPVCAEELFFEEDLLLDSLDGAGSAATFAIGSASTAASSRRGFSPE